MDSISILWVAKNRTVPTILPQNAPQAISCTQDGDVVALSPRGWALKEQVTPSRKSPAVKKFLDEIWRSGECTGMKADASNVAKLMRSKTTSDGARMFSPQQWLSARQIMNYFSRLTATKTMPNISDCEDIPANLIEDVEVAEAAERTQSVLLGL
jgi:hypothetical protein